jgi:two-component system cell cycle sensor histidine kinase/response regulator CckA
VSVQRFSNRTTSMVVVFVVGLVTSVELVFGERSRADISVVAVLVAVTAAALVYLYAVTGSLKAAVASGEELQMRVAQQQAVATFGQFALSDVPRAELLDEAATVTARGLGAEYCSILERVGGGPALKPRAAVGWPAELMGPDVSMERSQAGYTLTSGGPVILVDVDREARFVISSQMTSQRIRSGVSAPIGTNGSAFGVLSAHTRKQRHFSEDDVNFVQSVANVLASAVRKRDAEQEVERSNALFEAVIEGTTDEIFVKDTGGRFLALNAAAAHMLGVEPADAIGRTVAEVVPGSAAEEMSATDRVVLERGVATTFEETFTVRGEQRVCLSTKAPYRGHDGTILGTLGIAHDITARKLQERALERSEERFRLAQEGAHMGTWEVDVATGQVNWSDGLRTLLGVDADYRPGDDSMRLVHPDDRERVRRVVDDVEDVEQEYRIVRPDGEERWILTRSTLVSEEGKPARRLGVAVDTTERKRTLEELGRLESRLRQAEKLEVVGQLAGGVAHDFNNLLVALRGYAEFALAKLEKGEDGVVEHIEGILACADRATILTKQLLAFGRRQVLVPEVLDLNDVVVDMSSLLRRVLGGNMELQTVLTGAPVLVEADRGQLEQVITNLAVNARDAMPGGGMLAIELRRALGSAVLSVRDSGTGMDPETVARVFEPFFTTKGAEGTGLGLATVHGIVSQSGGEITLDTAPGRGTTFHVSLPLSDAPPPPAAAAAPAVDVSGAETVLVVEDDPSVRSVVAAMLRANGYSVLSAGDGNEAATIAEDPETRVDLVLSDLMMRGLDGHETVLRIRARRPDVKVLYMSGYTDDAIIRNGDLEPGTAFVQKPFSGEELAARVRRLLDGSGA